MREVRAPYAETTTLHAGEATIERAGQAPRRFALSRVPELAGLQASFGALLAGDREALQRHYALQADGTRQRWTLTLTPTDAALSKKLDAVVLHGTGSELRCIESRPAGRGDVQRTLLGSAARDAAQADAAGLDALCRGDAER